MLCWPNKACTWARFGLWTPDLQFKTRLSSCWKTSDHWATVGVLALTYVFIPTVSFRSFPNLY